MLKETKQYKQQNRKGINDVINNFKTMRRFYIPMGHNFYEEIENIGEVVPFESTDIHTQIFANNGTNDYPYYGSRYLITPPGYIVKKFSIRKFGSSPFMQIIKKGDTSITQANLPPQSIIRGSLEFYIPSIPQNFLDTSAQNISNNQKFVFNKTDISIYDKMPQSQKDDINGHLVQYDVENIQSLNISVLWSKVKKTFQGNLLFATIVDTTHPGQKNYNIDFKGLNMIGYSWALGEHDDGKYQVGNALFILGPQYDFTDLLSNDSPAIRWYVNKRCHKQTLSDCLKESEYWWLQPRDKTQDTIKELVQLFMETDYNTFSHHFDDTTEIQYNDMKAKCVKIIMNTFSTWMTELDINFNGQYDEQMTSLCISGDNRYLDPMCACFAYDSAVCLDKTCIDQGYKTQKQIKQTNICAGQSITSLNEQENICQVYNQNLKKNGKLQILDYFNYGCAATKGTCNVQKGPCINLETDKKGQLCADDPKCAGDCKYGICPSNPSACNDDKCIDNICSKKNDTVCPYGDKSICSSDPLCPLSTCERLGKKDCIYGSGACEGDTKCNELRDEEMKKKEKKIDDVGKDDDSMTFKKIWEQYNIYIIIGLILVFIIIVAIIYKSTKKSDKSNKHHKKKQIIQEEQDESSSEEQSEQ